MKVLIFDPDHRGHHLQFVRILADALSNSGFDVVAGIGKPARESAEGKVHLADINPRITLDDSLESPPLDGILKNAKFRLAQFNHTLANHRVDHAFIPYGDGLIQLMGMKMSGRFYKDLPIEALIFHGGRKETWKGRAVDQVHNYLFRRSPCKRIHFLSPFAYDSAIHSGMKEKFRVMPEPVEAFPTRDSVAARQKLGIDAKGKILGCMGMITAQKNVDRLIDAFLACKTSPDNRLLLVGRQDTVVMAKLDSLNPNQRDRIIELNRYVENETFLNAIVASDVVSIPYKNRGASSGILVRAIQVGKTVITDEGGLLGWQTRHFDLGATCNVHHHDSFKSAIANCLNSNAKPAPNLFREKLVNFHSTDNFCRSWMELLNNNGPSLNNFQAPISWDSVIAG